MLEEIEVRASRVVFAGTSNSPCFPSTPSLGAKGYRREKMTKNAKVRPSTLNCAILNRFSFARKDTLRFRPALPPDTLLLSGDKSMRRLRFIFEDATSEVIVFTLVTVDLVIVWFLLAQ